MGRRWIEQQRKKISSKLFPFPHHRRARQQGLIRIRPRSIGKHIDDKGATLTPGGIGMRTMHHQGMMKRGVTGL